MKITMIVSAALLMGTMAHAADTVKKNETTTDTSKNPITGTVTEETTTEKKMKTAKGEATSKVTKTKKTHKDGKVEHSTEAESDSSTH